MKILLAIQGTGNGHLSRAEDIYPELCKYGEVDVLVSGIQADIMASFPVRYRLYGCSFIFGSNGGVDIWQTIRRLRPVRLFRDMKRLKIEEYDWVISDFEPVSVWACRKKGKKVYGLSHQSAVMHPLAARPGSKQDKLGAWILKNYAPCHENVGFYIKAIPSDIFPALIRSSVRNLQVQSGEDIVVYLPSYSAAAIVRVLEQIPQVNWKVFSKHEGKSWQQANVRVEPVNNDRFLTALATCKGVLMGAGFEGPCEALYLGKKVLVIPMTGQYEQQCNAAALASVGVPVIPLLSDIYIPRIIAWLQQDQKIDIVFPEDTAQKAVRRLYELRIKA